MKSYDLPGETSGMTPLEARQVLNRLRADILADRAHPFNETGHPQHEDFSACFKQLNTIIQQGATDAQAERAAEELAADLGDDVNLTPLQCLARAKELLRTPGYIIGTGSLLSAERERLTRKIHALHQVANQDPEPTQEMEIDPDDL